VRDIPKEAFDGRSRFFASAHNAATT